MLTVDVDGVGLSYAENGQGQDVVFVHGIPTDHRAWNAQIGPFSKNYRVIAYSRRHAQPSNNESPILESTIENNAKDLEGLIRKTATPPVHLVGHSYGGFIAAHLASLKPDLIKKLVLIEPGITTLLVEDEKSLAQMLSLLLRSPSIALAAGTFIRKYQKPLLEAYHKGDLEHALRLFLDGIMNKPGALDQLPREVQTMLKENAQTLGELETKLPSFTEKDARKISSPTLLMYGTSGTKVLRAIIKKLAKSIPNNQLIAIPDSTHFPHFENSERFNEKALGFLNLR
jgi:pimeloyl-ACP methyl ester carboxylesterase